MRIVVQLQASIPAFKFESKWRHFVKRGTSTSNKAPSRTRCPGKSRSRAFACRIVTCSVLLCCGETWRPIVTTADMLIEHDSICEDMHVKWEMRLISTEDVGGESGNRGEGMGD